MVRLTIAPVPRAPESVVHVYLEDVTYADAPARTLHHEVRPAIPDSGGRLKVEFDPPAELPSRCNVRVHVDMDGDGEVSRGDYITTQAYTLSATLEIRLTAI